MHCVARIACPPARRCRFLRPALSSYFSSTVSTASTAAPTTASVNASLERPLSLPIPDQLSRMRDDDEERGQRPFRLPDKTWPRGAALPVTWGEYFAERGNFGDDVLDDRLLLQALTGAFSCTLTTAAAVERFCGSGVQVEADAGEAEEGTDGAAVDVSTPASPSSSVSSRPLNIHIVGAAASHEEALLTSFWPELSLLLPGHPSVNLSLVGPDTSAPFEAELGPEGASTRLWAVVDPSDYLAWRATPGGYNHSPPDLVLAFQPGVRLEIERENRRSAIVGRFAAAMKVLSALFLLALAALAVSVANLLWALWNLCGLIV